MSRYARAVPCTRCPALILEGDDADTLAFRVQVDPQPLDRDSELRAILDGRDLYRFDRRGLSRRSPAAAVKGRHPGDLILGAHQCPGATISEEPPW